MTERSYFWTTGGAGDGASTYTRADLQRAHQVLAACSGFEGVAATLLNALAGTVGGANTVNINTGGGIVDGPPYYNDASVPVNIPSAVGAGNTRIDRIVLRAGWAAQTVRITRIVGTDAASPTPPAITQTSGTTYDIMLYQALVNTGGTVTLTDERVWAAVTVNGIGASAVTAAKISATVAGDGLSGGAGAALSVNVDGVGIEINADALRLKDLGTATAKLANNAATDAKIRQSAGLSLIGRSANSAGNVADITGADGQVVRVLGTVLGFGTIVEAGLANNVVTDAKLRQGAALTVIGRSANSAGNVADIAAGADGHVLRRSGTTVGFGAIATAGLTDGILSADAAGRAKMAAAFVQTAHIGPSQVTPAEIANRTRALWVPVTGGYNTTDAAYIHQASQVGRGLMPAKLSTCWGSFYLPSDWASGLTIKAVLGNVAVASANIYALNQAEHAAVGELFSTHSDASAYSAVAVVQSQINVIKTVTPTNVTAGDYFLLLFARDGTNGGDTLNYYTYLLGWLVEYTADS